MSLSVKAARMSGQGGISRRTNVRGGGLLGSIVGGIKKGLGVVAATVTGGPLAGASTALRAFTGSSRPSVPAMPGLVGSPQQVPVPGARGALERLVPGGRTGMMACPAGHRPNKSSYFLKDGTFVEKGSVCVRIRRRNPFNPRALDRAMSRLESAGRGAKRLGFRAPSPRQVAQAGARKGRRRRR